MPVGLHIGLVGDYDPSVAAHQAIPRALVLAGAVVGTAVTPSWLPTADILETSVLADYS